MLDLHSCHMPQGTWELGGRQRGRGGGSGAQLSHSTKAGIGDCPIPPISNPEGAKLWVVAARVLKHWPPTLL